MREMDIGTVGFSRAYHDTGRRIFVRLPSATKLMSARKQVLISEIESAFGAGEYSPEDMSICEVPKPNAAHRPGALLTMRDRVAYATIVSRLLPSIDTVLAKTKLIDLGNQRNGKKADAELFHKFFQNWKAFATKSVENANRYAFVVICDVAGFYENVDLQRLCNDLKEAGCKEADIKLLREMLYRWSDQSARGRGLPQGHSASDLLAKFYLSSFDREIRDQSIVHLRYNDDIRAFCRTRREAERTLSAIIRQLRKRGLILQSAKTKVLPSTEAVPSFQGSAPIIDAIRNRIAADAAQELEVPSIPTNELAAVLENNPVIEREAVRTAFRAHVIEKPGHFDKSLLHYLFNQLARHKDRFGLSTALTLLRTNPEETEAILGYLSKLSEKRKLSVKLRRMLSNRWDDRSYQQYQVVIWFLENYARVGGKTMRECRRLVSSPSQPSYLRDAAKELIRKFGGPDDFEAVRASFSKDLDDESRAMSLLSISRQDPVRRNVFYKKHGGRSSIGDKAIELAKSAS
ncbi:MAG: hypothetical protein QOF78_4594 [Phycisphaerales bacterium]|nr:hypothetical protein [Phycisphaerales bacterium]